MLKFNSPFIRPFKIDYPTDKGGEQQPYLHGCYNDAAILMYEVLYCEWKETEILPGVIEVVLPTAVSTPNGTNILFSTHPSAAMGKAPIIIPTSFRTDWWQGDLKLWMKKSDLKFNHMDPIAIATVVKREMAKVAEMNEDEKRSVAVFSDYISTVNKTRPNNSYETACWLNECGKLSIKPKKKYRIV